MRKIVLLGLALAVGLLGVSRNAFCASVGGPGTDGGFSIGLEQDYIFDRDLTSQDVSYSEGSAELSGTLKYKVKDLGRTMLKIGWQMSKNLNVYAKLGVTNSGGKLVSTVSGDWTDGIDNGTFSGKEEDKSNSAFCGGMGLKLIVPLKDNWIIGADAQYLAHKNDFSGEATLSVYDDLGNLLGKDTMETSGTATIYEWHIAPFVAKSFGKFVPYAGIKYSDMLVKPDGMETIKAKNNLGGFVGANFNLSKNFTLNLEGRFADESAMSMAAVFNF
jgi:opacity protein-like surface antigen